MTEEQKNLIEQLNVYFKMKEDECETLLQKKYNEVVELQKTLPVKMNPVSIVSLCYKHLHLFEKSIPDGFTKRKILDIWVDDPLCVAGIPVCLSMYRFFNRICKTDMNLLKLFANDIPGRLENVLRIDNEMRLSKLTIINPSNDFDF